MEKKNRQIKIGIGLILLSGVAFAVMLIIPFLEIEKQVKIVWASSAFIVMEVLFYTGGFFVGKELFKKYKNYLNPKTWFKKKSN
ncbi:MAG: transporter suffix domain-containing protein [Bacteroidales bacterium]|nr:transporter suffix domain-containing protein [Bacteroidales bacterium]MCF8457535.1 transporter suffix domain-containing protein [Bacteroidales bacterium]